MPTDMVLFGTEGEGSPIPLAMDSFLLVVSWTLQNIIRGTCLFFVFRLKFRVQC